MTRKNKVTTCGYFIKRLRDSGYNVNRIFTDYGQGDHRRWTIVVNPGVQTLFITCTFNKTFKDEVVFEFDDGGNNFQRNFSLKTESMEVVVTYLYEQNVYPLNNGTRK